MDGEKYILESIVEVEPEVLQISNKNVRLAADEKLKQKFGIFTEAMVLLREVNFGAELKENDEAFELARKGNEGLAWHEKHICCLCKKVLNNRSSLIGHLRNFHGKAPKLFCDLCPTSVHDKTKLNQHMKVHQAKAFACNVCDFRTAYKKGFEDHKLRHATKETCKICNKQVTSLKSHLATIHQPRKACPVCKKMVAAHHLTDHIRRHDLWSCKDCGDKFTSKNELKGHTLKKHYYGKVFECHCGSVFAENYHLTAHQRVHSSQMFKCEACPKTYKTEQNFKNHWVVDHSKTHGPLPENLVSKATENNLIVLNKTGPFICDKCGSKLKNRHAFNNHQNLQHQKLKTFYCDLCPKTFRRKCLLPVHMKQYHLKLRPFACNACEYATLFPKDLRDHMLRHGSKTECKICNKLVTNMSEHMRNHIIVKCPVCRKDCSKVSLPQHLKKHKKK